ncbi:MAG: sensor domain-containing diguanylate cyclase [Bacillota bacterium]|nr:sensor domain-containing diguanylate cyclase [Bacillota bacterium]
MLDYHTKTKYFYTLIFKNYKVEVLHTSVASTQKNFEATPYILASCSFKLDENFTLIDINDNLLNILQYSNKEEFLKSCHHQWSNCIHKKDLKEVKDVLLKNISSNPIHQLEYRILKKDGSYLWAYDQGQYVFNNEKYLTVQCFITDISAIKDREINSIVEKEKYEMALKDNSISILEYHIQEDKMIIDILEESKKRVYNHYLEYISSDRTTVFKEDRQKIIDLFTLKTKDSVIYREFYRNSKNYCVKALESTIIYNSNNEPEIILATASDITTSWNEQNNLKQKVQRDSLTHLYNFKAGKYLADDYIKKHPFDKHALIVLDVDHFKNINDTFGHLVGNDLLVSLAKYLLVHNSNEDIVIRMGGDEFVIFIKETDKIQIQHRCEELLDCLDEITLKHQDIPFSLSLGVYLFDHNTLFDDAFEYADEALYQSKNSGRHRFTIHYQVED